MSDVQNNLTSRRSIYRFKTLKIEKECLEIAFKAASRAPCHKDTHPWKFYVMGDETRDKLIPTVEKLAIKKAIGLDDSQIDSNVKRAKDKILNVPIIIAVTSSLSPEDKFREKEDYAATVCALHNLVLSLWDQGIGSQWSTGSITRHKTAYEAIGISQQIEEIIGFLKVGYPEKIPSKKKKDFSEIRYYLP